MDLSLNKSDLLLAASLTEDVRGPLTLHKDHISTPISTQEDMGFLKRRIFSGPRGDDSPDLRGGTSFREGTQGFW